MHRYLLVTAFLTKAAFGCLHFAQDYKGHLKEGTKVAFLFHDGKNAHVVLKTDIQAEEGKLPPEVAWVVPFPSLPSKYEEVEPGVFDELGALVAVPSKNVRGMWGGEKSAGAANGIRVHEAQTVGNYRVQPVEITADGAARDLDSWLVANHFNPMPAENQKLYLRKGAVFLAIRAKVDDTQMHFKPLHVVYKADRLSFPLKFTHDTRTFDLDLYVMTPKGSPPGALAKHYLDDDGAAAYPPPHSGKKLRHLTKLLGSTRGVIRRYRGGDMNGEGRSLKTLEGDPVVVF